jgi:hypothetical protein
VPDVTTSLAQEIPTSAAVGDEGCAVGDSPSHEETEIDNVQSESVPVAEKTDNAMSVEETIVDLERMENVEFTGQDTTTGSIARRLRQRKRKETEVVPETTKSTKKNMVGPNRRPSKVEVPSQKK